MKRAQLCIYAFLTIFVFIPAAHAITIKIYHPIPFEGPGVPPKDAFPLVCYVVGIPYSLIDAIKREDEAVKAAAVEGKVIPQRWKEKFKDGLPWPMYLGYYVVYDDFHIYHVNTTGNYHNAFLEDLNRESPTIDLKVPRWSWHGALSSLRLLARYTGLNSMAFTLGVPPDTSYVPQIRKPALVPIEHFLEPSDVVFSPKETDFDATIINPKPGMTFKVFDNDFTIP